jgi:hypothetical protein
MNHQESRYAKRFRDDLHDIEQPLTMIPIMLGCREFVSKNHDRMGSNVDTGVCLGVAIALGIFPGVCLGPSVIVSQEVRVGL